MIIAHYRPLVVGQIVELPRLFHEGEYHDDVRCYVLSEATRAEWIQQIVDNGQEGGVEQGLQTLHEHLTTPHFYRISVD